MNIEICKHCECCWCFEKNNRNFPLIYGYRFLCLEPCGPHGNLDLAPYGSDDFPFYFIHKKEFFTIKKYAMKGSVDYPYTDFVFRPSPDTKTNGELARVVKGIKVNDLCRYYLEQQLFDWNKNES